MMLNSSRLPMKAERAASKSEGRPTIQLSMAARNTAKPPNQASTTGSNSFSFCTQATLSRPTRVEADVAIRMGRNTAVGSAEPCWARYRKMVTGSRVTDEVLRTRNRICALVAVSWSGFRVCRSFIAFRPMGVAALSRPRKLAARFMVTEPSAG